MTRVAVASRSFSKNIFLRERLISIYPDCKFNDSGEKLEGESLVNFLSGCDKAITALEEINEKVLSKLPDLKVIGKYGVGLDMIDLAAMDKYSVKLGWTPGVNKNSVAELVVATAIGLSHRIFFSNYEVRSSNWYQVQGRELNNLTIGIIGCGNIGKQVVKFLQPFGCKIISHDILDLSDFYNLYNVEAATLQDLLKQSDIVTLHLPLDKTTKNILNSENLYLLKDGSMIINFARGGLIDEVELKKILSQENGISSAALDVFEVEPPQDQELVNLPNVFVTPHIGGSTEEAIIAMGLAAIEGLNNARVATTFKL